MSDTAEVLHLAVGGRWLGDFSVVPPPRADVLAVQCPSGMQVDLLSEPQKLAHPVCKLFALST